MARIVKEAEYTEKRNAILDAAQRLIDSKGYEQMAIQDILDDLQISKGAFYHYFDSKQALLDGVVERFGDAAMAAVAPILADQSLPALGKMERVFSTISQLKAEQKALVLAILEVWVSDANAIVRERLRRMSVTRLGPIFSAVIRQGIDEGVIRSSSPDEMARVLLYLLQGYEELAVEHFLGRQAGTIEFDQVARTYAAFTEAFERVLGVPQGSLTLMDGQTLHFWFG